MIVQLVQARLDPRSFCIADRAVATEVWSMACISMASTTVTNTSSQTVNLTIAATKDWDDFSYGFLPGSTCSTFEPMPLAPGESCVFEIRFLPSTDFLGLKQDQIFRATATDPVTGMVLDEDRFVFYGRAR